MLIAVLSIAMFRNFHTHGRDFETLWKIVQHVLSGDALYSVARDQNMVWKYPPWALPFFIPFGLLSLESAKFLWAIFQILCFLAITRWTIQRCMSPLTFFISTLAFIGLWQVNAMDGQLSMLFVATWLWAGETNIFKKLNLKSFFLFYFSSFKIFTFYPLVSLNWSKGAIVPILKILLILAALSIPAWIVSDFVSPLEFVKLYSDTISSSGQYLGESVRGRYQPSLTAFFMRLFEVPAIQTHWDVVCALILAVVLGLGWKKFSKKLSPDERWVGWIALTAVIHPLPFWYSFVFAYPLCALALDRAFSTRSLFARAISILGLFFVAVATEKTLGTFGQTLELLSIKSFGVLLSAFALVKSR